MVLQVAGIVSLWLHGGSCVMAAKPTQEHVTPWVLNEEERCLNHMTFSCGGYNFAGGTI